MPTFPCSSFLLLENKFIIQIRIYCTLYDLLSLFYQMPFIGIIHTHDLDIVIRPRPRPKYYINLINIITTVIR